LKIAVISDIHGNLPALQNVIDDIRAQKVDKIYCLGDIIGYGPHPAECLKLIREVADMIIYGNHEDAIVYPERYAKVINPFAWHAILYSRECLNQKDLNYLATLPFSHVFTEIDITLAHGSFNKPHSFEYIRSAFDAQKDMTVTPTRVTFIGRTHKPLVHTSIHPV